MFFRPLSQLAKSPREDRWLGYCSANGVSAVLFVQLIQEAAAKTEDFSGRELAKLMVSMQGAAYGSQKSELTPELFREVLDYKVAEHVQRKKIAEQQESSKIKAWAPS